MKRLLVFVALVFLASMVGATHLAAQDLAITNVRIIVGNGTVIDNGSIVARGAVSPLRVGARSRRHRAPAA